MCHYGFQTLVQYHDVITDFFKNDNHIVRKSF